MDTEYVQGLRAQLRATQADYDAVKRRCNRTHRDWKLAAKARRDEIRAQLDQALQGNPSFVSMLPIQPQPPTSFVAPAIAAAATTALVQATSNQTPGLTFNASPMAGSDIPGPTGNALTHSVNGVTYAGQGAQSHAATQATTVSAAALLPNAVQAAATHAAAQHSLILLANILDQADVALPVALPTTAGQAVVSDQGHVDEEVFDMADSDSDTDLGWTVATFEEEEVDMEDTTS